MTRLASVAIFVLSCIVAALLGYLAIFQLPNAIANDSEGWNSLAFRIAIAPVFCAVLLFFAVIPSAILYRKKKQSLDRKSLWFSSIMLGLVLIAWLVFEPLRQFIIFRH